jgi:glycosyltransferase involved in cell wall biosynthesis
MKDPEQQPAISVITAAKNVEATLGVLYESLQRQTFRGFEWIVVDGRSTDATCAMLEEFCSRTPWMRYRSEADFGIYDAINRGIAAARGDYYVVAGADDSFAPDALENYRDHAVKTRADVVLARVVRAGTIIGGFHPKRAWLGHSKVFCGSHSVGMLFRRSLHETFGPYSQRFPMLADGFFLKKLLNSRAAFADAAFVAGTFGAAGISSTSKLQTLAETWQIQMLTEPHRILQVCLLVGKIVVKYPGLRRELRHARVAGAGRARP